VRSTAALARPKGVGIARSAYYPSASAAWRGGGNKDRTHKRSFLAADYQVIASLSSYMRLTTRISGPPSRTDFIIRNSLRRLRWMPLLDRAQSQFHTQTSLLPVTALRVSVPLHILVTASHLYSAALPIRCLRFYHCLPRRSNVPHQRGREPHSLFHTNCDSRPPLHAFVRCLCLG
jgi:hypothetical protein